MVKDSGPPVDGARSAAGDPSDGHRPPPGAEFAVVIAPPLLPARGPLRPVFRAIGALEKAVGGLLLALILVLVMILVIRRYTGGGWPGTGELARYSLVWATFLLAGYLVAHHPFHISIQLIDYIAKGRWLGAVKLFVDLVVLLTSLVLVYGCYQLVASDIGQVTPAAGMPLRYINMVPLAGFALVAMRAVLGIVIRDIPTLMGRNVGSP